MIQRAPIDGLPGVPLLTERSFPDFRFLQGSYLRSMVQSHVRVMRMIALVLSFSIATQPAAAQAANCRMSGMTGADNHPATMQHRHDVAPAAGSLPDGRGSESRNSGNTGCAQVMICINVPAIPAPAISGGPQNEVSQPIPFPDSALEPRALHPEPPPPRN